jgi:hypothetical protein
MRGILLLDRVVRVPKSTLGIGIGIELYYYCHEARRRKLVMKVPEHKKDPSNDDTGNGI